jgi:hypothetical protein
MTPHATDLLPPGVSSEVVERQLRRYRAMSYEEKLHIADDLGRLAWELTSAGIRRRHPELDETRVRSAAVAAFRAATD